MRAWILAAALISCGTRTPVDADASLDSGNDVTDEVAPCVHLDGGDFACGDASCNSNIEYCSETVGGPPPGVDIAKCVPLPSACNAVCVDADTSNDCHCDDDDGGRIHVVCLVP